MSLDRNRNYNRAASLDLLNIAQHLLEQLFNGAERNHKRTFLYQGYRSVFKLARSVCLGVNIRNLLQFQRSLKRNRIVKLASEEEHAFAVIIL